MTQFQRQSLPRLLGYLRCPECQQGTLLASGEVLSCSRCGQSLPLVEGVPFLFSSESLPEYLSADRRQPVGPIRPNRNGKQGGSYHWREYRIEEFLPPPELARDVLLLGCGDGGERPYLHQLGYDTIAFDIRRSPGTDFLADAHRLPLQDGKFDMVLSMQVLEHLHSPWLAVEEIARVLRPGGWFVGSVAFLKAYHKSYFHMSHRGVDRLLRSAGLEVDRLAGAQSLTYTLYGTLLPIGRRSFRRWLYGGVDRAIGDLRARLWSMRSGEDPDAPTDRFDEDIPMSFRSFDKLRFAPAVVFRARKSGDRSPSGRSNGRTSS